MNSSPRSPLSTVVARNTAARRLATARLGLERLEERWTPAVSVVDGGSAGFTISDDATGKTSNAIEIIDDLGSQTTYLKINGGAEQQLGAGGALAGTIAINMGVGNDRVVFSVRNGTICTTSLSRTIDLGAGNDVLAIATAGDYQDGTVAYLVQGDATGNDSYSLAGDPGNATSFLFEIAAESAGNDRYSIAATSHEAGFTTRITDSAGNDVYTVVATARDDDGVTELLLVDSAGNDKYRVTIAGQNCEAINFKLTDSTGVDSYAVAVAYSYLADVSLEVHDSGIGKDAIKFSQANLENVDLFVGLSLAGADAHSFALGGDARFTAGCDVRFEVAGGTGADAVKVDENSIAGASAVVYDFDLGLGNDAVSVQLDGDGTTASSALSNGASERFSASLGDGNDSFSVTTSSFFQLESFGSAAPAGLSFDVKAGNGNDRLKFAASSRRDFSLKGENARCEIEFDGGAGDDSIAIDLGRLVGSGDGLPAYLEVEIDAGDGLDVVSLAGRLLDSTASLALLEITLGDGDGRDVFTSKLRSEATQQFAFDGDSFLDSGAEDARQFVYSVYGQTLDQYLDLI